MEMATSIVTQIANRSPLKHLPLQNPQEETMPITPDFDVVIIGAGISGINTAYHIQSNFPKYKYCILEARDAIGGTWDLFKYPGIRSDSDLFTFGFQWYPWDQNNPIGTGESILRYLEAASEKFGIDKNIRLDHRLQHASWSTECQEWSLWVSRGHEIISISTRFMVLGTGYYNYVTPLEAQIPGINDFKGQVIHPQFWPKDLDYVDKKVIIIGSGATAITLLPNLAEKAKLVTMVQRSPSYIVSMPNYTTKSWLHSLLPRFISLFLKRLSWFVRTRLFFQICKVYPAYARRLLKRTTVRRLPAHIPFDPHFNPRYDPWIQRLCVSPNGDFFKALHRGHADVVTGTIKTVTPTGIELESGQSLEADIIITATGLKLQIGGGATLDVDGKTIAPSEKFLWRGTMLQDVPNAAVVLGYTNASWTLGADATAATIVRVLRILQKRYYTSTFPRVKSPEKLETVPFLNLQSTYLNTMSDVMPKTTTTGVFARRDNYFVDIFRARYGSLQGLEWVRCVLKEKL